MPRSRIGPLAIESPLGDAQSNVFRALHIEQRVQLAVRVFSIPFGMTPEAKQDFAKQMEMLKTLRHEGIVSCFGGGFDQRDAYLVYELIDGESLESLLERRNQIPWETVLDFSRQLCDALQFAHSRGWAHGYLRPDKILVTSDSRQTKIADFRSQANANNLIQRPLSVDEVAYCAPEAIDGTGDSTSDLYSLGANMYRMLTGHSVFAADSVNDMRLKVQTETPPSVSTLVFDCPVWLSAIVDQCLEKEPAKRPFSAESLSISLSEAEHRAASGIGVAEHAVSGFSSLKLSTVDKDEAEEALGRKNKTRREIHFDLGSILENPLFLVGCLVAIFAVVLWFMMPLGETKLRERAEPLLSSDVANDWWDARDMYLSKIVEGYPDGKHYDWAVEQIKIVAMKTVERKMQRAARIGLPPDSEVERRYIDAQRFENFGDRVTALDKYRAIVNLFKKEPEAEAVVNLARRQVSQIEANPPTISELREFLTSRLDEADEKFMAEDYLAAKQIWDSVVSLYESNKEVSVMVERAKNRQKKMREIETQPES